MANKLSSLQLKKSWKLAINSIYRLMNVMGYTSISQFLKTKDAMELANNNIWVWELQ